MKTKTKINMDLKTRKKKNKRILPTAKRGGILPVLLLLGILGSLVSSATGVIKIIVNDNKAAQRQLELKRHNRIMKGRSYYLASYKRGQGIARKKKKRLM